jgi:two-component system, OmpR family, response regulator QseB
MHILLVEDDLDLGRALLQSLKSEGLTGQWVRRAADALIPLKSEPIDCILLDLTLPDGSGLDLLQRWRREKIAVPIVIITARSALEDRLIGLDSGADDYLIKPFAPAELISRIRAVVRRSAQQASDLWKLGDLEIEPRRHVVRLNGQLVDLSAREFQLLKELASAAGSVVPKGTLAQRLVPLGDPLDFSALEVHMSNLRRKIGASRIRTVRGVGYALEL